MGLSNSLYTGYSGMFTHQRSLDNLGNNLANVNTVGYRKSDFMFTNLLNQVISGSMAAAENRSTVSAKTVGHGATTGAILNNFTQGPIESTGNPLDVAISGNGFFLVSTSYGTALTRNGSFYLDHTLNPNERMLCVGDGLAVQGWNAVNGVVSPSTTNVGNIYLPAYGDMLPGKVTSQIDFRGIMPTNTSSSDFNGSLTTDLDLKGNLSSGSSLVTSIYAPVTQSDGSKKDEIEEIKVRIDFSGPTLSADGSTNAYTWTMTTIDWPNAGDAGVQIYPPTGDTNFSQGAIKFHTSGSATNKNGAGQAVDDEIYPGSAKISVTLDDGQGGTVTSSFTLSSDFNIDVSRLTNLADAPGGNALETWHVNGNPKGTMARTVLAYDEFTDFEETTDANGNTVMQAVRRVEARENTLYFTRSGLDDNGATWSWRSSLDDATGTLRFNSIGDLVSQSGGGGSIAYNFSEVSYLNSDGSLQATAQDGYRDGYLKDITIDQYGKISGHYTNDVIETLALLAMGNVANPSGLSGASGTLFYTSSSSGALQIGVAGDADGSLYDMAAIGAGSLVTSSLEGSNVNLAQSFTELISIERGYQLNGKIITTSDEMLQTARDMKR